MRIKKVAVVLLSLFIAAVLAAGCGGSGGAQGGATQNAATSQSGTTVAVSENSKLGKILVDGSGKTLYLFESDEEGDSTCHDACARVWPPLTTQGDPTAGQGASAGKLGTISRENGNTQVTYNGHPLYYYAPDSQPGDTKGQGLEQFGGEWYVVSPSGDKVEKGEKEDGSGGSDDSGGGGGGY